MKKNQKALDKLVSEAIRKRAIQRAGGCERCGAQKHDIVKDDGDIFPAWKQLQWSHYHGRRKLSVRWDEDNGSGLCGGCHFHVDNNPDDHTEFKLKQIGEQRLENLKIRARIPQKVDINLLTLYYRNLIKEIEG